MVALLFWLLTGIIGQDPATEELSPDPRLRCGVDSLYLACNQLGGDFPTYKDYLDRFVLSSEGSSMESLQREANQMGISSLAVALHTNQLERVLENSGVPMVAICHLARGHYVLAYRSGVKQFTLVDTSRELRTVDSELKWEEAFSGNCLLLSREPLDLAQIQAWSDTGVTGYTEA